MPQATIKKGENIDVGQLAAIKAYYLSKKIEQNVPALRNIPHRIEVRENKNLRDNRKVLIEVEIRRR